MSKEKVSFDTISPKMVLGQLFKSINIMKIVRFKTTIASVAHEADSYCEEMSAMLQLLIEVHYGVVNKKELDEIPGAKYIDPIMHFKDITYYLEGNRKVFKTLQESAIVDDILALISKYSYRLTLD